MAPIDKKSLSERDICTKYITPALVTAGWDVQTQILEEVSFTDGQVIVKKKRVDRGSRNLWRRGEHASEMGCCWQDPDAPQSGERLPTISSIEPGTVAS